MQRSGEGEDDFDPIGDLKDCGDLYEELEVCLAEQNRDWTKCQKQVKAVRACVEAQAKAEAKETPSSKETNDKKLAS